jgi:hypothetical protein
MPWLEQLAKHDDKSPVYPCKTLFNWLPVLKALNKMFKEVEFVVVLVSVVKVLIKINT